MEILFGIEPKEESPMKKKYFQIAVASLVASVIGFGGIYQWRESVSQKQEKLALENEESADVERIVEPKVELMTESEVAKEEIEEKVVEEVQEDIPVENVILDTPHFTSSDKIILPVQGEILLPYSMDATVYDPTLEQYRYNPALFISGKVNDPVSFVANGVITSIEESAQTGCTVTQDLGDGYLVQYGQVKDVNFAVGDYVKQGQTVGYISEPTRYYSVEGSGVYFKMEKDSLPVDPMEFVEK